eukprot:6213259-Pleurochrysis_carterae.AAC.2
MASGGGGVGGSRAAPKGQKSRWKKARRTRDYAEDESSRGIEMQDFLSSVLQLDSSMACTFNMDSIEERRELADRCWIKESAESRHILLDESVHLRALFETLTRNSYRPVNAAAYEERRAMQFEALLCSLCRVQSQKRLTLLTARISLAALRVQLTPSMWRFINNLAPGLLASRDWTQEFAEFTTSFRPEPSTPGLPKVGAVMFDNYTRRTLYASQKTSVSGGFLLHMTNSCSMHVPRSLSPIDFNPMQLFRQPFRSPRLSMATFTTKFAFNNSEIVNNKKARFTAFLKNAAAGTLFKRPSTKPSWLAHLTYHEPMWYVLQSSYEDVETELNTLRNRHLDKMILFVGGDGLSIIRINHLIKLYPELYQDSAPLIIPVQGESPHGVYHFMHAGWRLYLRLLRVCAEELSISKAILDDPPVKAFNTSLYFLWRVTRAASEYFVFLSQTPGGVDIDLPDEFVAACQFNVDLQWLVHFLYDYAYLVLDFKQGVRAGASKHLDILWREFFAIGRSSTANKTNYVPMAIQRIFWSDALHPSLAELYHNLRSIPMSNREGSMVGWDCVIEWLNAAITEGVSHH